MKINATQTGFALYKEADVIGRCDVTPTPKGADITALSVLPQWRRKGYGSYLLKEILRRFGGYDREAATVFTSPLPADEGEGLFWQKFGFVPEDGRLVRRRTPDLTAVRFCAGLSCRPSPPPEALHRRHLRQRRRHGIPLPPCRPGRPGAGLRHPARGHHFHPRPARKAGPYGRAYLRQPREPLTVCPASHGGHRDVQLRLAARGRPQRLLHSRQQHPCTGSRPRGAARRRRAQRHPLQRARHRHGRKAEHPRLAAGSPAGKIYRTGVRFCQLGRHCAPALPCSEKIAKTLASMWIFC